MAEVLAQAEVRLWGDTVGAIVELADGRIVFEYDPEFARRGIEISPMRLPVERRGPQSFEELSRSPSFGGLPGVFADSLPDAFGNKVIRAWFAARGRTADAMSPVQRLLYVGTRALGALTYHPATDIPLTAAEQVSLELADLVRDARRIVEGKPDVAVPEIYRIGASAGGMRPKAVVLHDPMTGTLRSGHAPPRPGEIAAILKFDGVGDGQADGVLGVPQHFNRVEAAYGAMARTAGLETADIHMLEQDGYAHLLITRFDLEDGERIHQHTLGGLIHVDYNDPGAASYEEYLRAVLRLGMAGGRLEEAFRRAVFNVTAVNQDDHVKNLSFALPRDGEWDLTPAYDLTFASGAGFTRRHQMRLADKTEGITAADLLACAKIFGLKRPQRILDEVREAVTRWSDFAAATGVPEDRVAAIESRLAARRAELDG